MTQLLPARQPARPTAPLKVFALHVGTLLGFPAPAITYQRGWGERHDVSMIMFVITGGEHPVVVDTGTPDADFVKEHHGYDLIRPPEQEPLAALERIGVDPADVGTIIHTHLHWDHCSNDDLFPAAKVLVQKSELQYAIDPAPPTRVAYERVPGLLPPWVKALDRLETVDGDAAVLPGISVVALPGHTPGSQGILVDGADQRYLLAGDCVDLYENWNGDERLDHIPSGSFTNLLDYMDSFRRMELLDCVVVPSHDPEVIRTGTFG